MTTADGMLYFINFSSRQVEKIIQIHDGKISGIVKAPNNQFYVTCSEQGVIRIWTPDFETLKSEVNTGSMIDHIDVNIDSDQICVLST